MSIIQMHLLFLGIDEYQALYEATLALAQHGVHLISCLRAERLKLNRYLSVNSPVAIRNAEDCDGCCHAFLLYLALQQILTYEPPPHVPRKLTYFVEAYMLLGYEHILL
jgi:hypothetical protein